MLFLPTEVSVHCDPAAAEQTINACFAAGFERIYFESVGAWSEGIEAPRSPRRRGDPGLPDELDQEWKNMLGHQVPHLPPVDDYWSHLFEWLAGAPRPALQRAELRRRINPKWAPPRSVAAWQYRPWS